MSTTPFPRKESIFACLNALAESQAASELAPPETAGPAKVVAAVATGSNLGLSAEGLASQWVAEAEAIRSNAGRQCRNHASGRARYYGRAEQLEKCAEELRRQQTLPKSRQPEENTEMCNEPKNGGATS